MNDEDVERIRAFERECDDAYRGCPLLQLPNRSLARWYLLTVTEDILRAPVIGGRPARDAFQESVMAHRARTGLEYAMRWTSGMPDGPFRPPAIIHEPTYGLAAEMLTLGADYGEIIAPFTLWSRGLATPKFIDEGTIRFTRDTRNARFEALHRSFALSARPNFETAHPPAVSAAIDRVWRSARPSGKHRLSYRTSHRELQPVADYLRSSIDPRERLPEAWMLLGRPAQEIRAFLAVVRAIGYLHLGVYYHVLQLHPIETGALASATIVRPSSEWHAIFAKSAAISMELASGLVAALTLPSDSSSADVSLQPFVPIGGDLLALAPFLTLTAHLERNLLKLAARAHRQEYDATSSVFDEALTERCRSLAKQETYSFAARRSVPGQPHLPDIDAAFYDPASNALLLAELKASIEPSEPKEILLVIGESEAKALAQARLLKEYALSNPEAVWRTLFPGAPYPAPTLCVAVVLGSFHGSAASLDADIPSVMIGKLEQLCTSLPSLHDVCVSLGAFQHLPIAGVDFELRDLEVEIGSKRVIWDGVLLRGVDAPVSK